MSKVIRIGTRESQLALWQAECVRQLLTENDLPATIVGIKSEGDMDLQTPLYELGVQGVFTRNLDAALLAGKIDLAVHSLKDVPTVPAKGIRQAAVLPRGPVKDLLVWRTDTGFMNDSAGKATIATGSVRRKAQWLHRFPHHRIADLRGNVNTRLRKLGENDWQGAIFAAAGLERIGIRPEHSLELDWMLPAPAQGAIVVVCREDDPESHAAAARFNDAVTELCTTLERDFLRALLGGCSTPISAYACVKDKQLLFEGNIVSPDGKRKLEIRKEAPVADAENLGIAAASALLDQGAGAIISTLKSPPAS